MAVRRARATPAGGKGTTKGLAGGAVTVKGAKASALQIQTIEACLQTALDMGCSQRVLVAVVMCITQESSATPLNHGDAAGPDSCGPFQQRDPWGPRDQRLDPAGSTKLFLTVNKGPGVQGWQVVHGSLKNAPSPLSPNINKIQHSKYPDAYGQWESEATKTVDLFLQNHTVGGGDGATGGEARHDFEAGGDTDWWESTGSLTQDVQWSRWAAGNRLFFVSDLELAAQKPALVMDGMEPWVLGPPGFEGGPLRPVEEMTLRVAVRDWPLMPGAVVAWKAPPLEGRWVVAGATRILGSPDVEVRLRRPRPALPEPAQQKTSGAGDGTGADAAAGDFVSAGKQFTGGYTYGAGHGPSLTSMSTSSAMDCSSSCSKFLKMLNMFPGDQAISSGVFASSWGKPGAGSKLTIMANSTHVWIRFSGGSAGSYVRFDTSPHGDSAGRGPRLRTTSRGDDSRFTMRHWEGS